MEYKACYQALQAHLRNQYGKDLADMKSAIERTTGNDPQKREQLGSKLQLLTTALHILDRNITDASQDEYNALLHLGERIKSSVELYQAQKAKRTASRAAAAVGVPPASNHQHPAARGAQFQPLPLPAMLQPSDPSWELPLDFVSTIIADERKRLSPVPELTQLGPLQPPPPGASGLAGAPRMPPVPAPQQQQAGQQAADANPFMQQALAIAQGLPYAPSSAPHPINNSSINLPPLPGGGGSGMVFHHRPAPGIGRTAISVDLGSSAARMAMASAFYSASFNADGSGKPVAAASAPVAHKRRAAAVLGDDDISGCEGGTQPSTSAGSAVAAGAGSADGLRVSSLGNRAGGAAPTKYRSVSFDQARPLRQLRSCPDTELGNELWRGEGPSGSGGSITQASHHLRCTVSMNPKFEVQPASPADRSCQQQRAAPAAAAMTDTVSPFVHLAAQQQAAGGGAMPPPPPHRPPQQQASLGAAGLNNSFAVASLNTSLPAGELGPALGSARLSSNPSLTGEALLQHRQRQWQQLLSLRQQQLALQEQEAAAQAASGASIQASQQVPPLASQQDLSVSQMLLQGLGDMQQHSLRHSQQQQQQQQQQPGGSPMEPSKRSKHDSSAPPTSNPTSLSTSGSGNSCSNGGSAATAAAARASAAGGAGSPSPLLGGATVGLPGSSSLTAATARLRLDPSTELATRPGQPASSQPQGWDPSASIEAFMMAAAAGGDGMAAQQQQRQQQQQQAACFFGYNPADQALQAQQAQQAQQPLQGQPQLTSGLPGLNAEAINDFAQQLQPSGPSLTGWAQQLVPTSPRGTPSPSNPQTPSQQLGAVGGAAPAAAAPPGGSSGGGFLAQMELGPLEDGSGGVASGGSAFAAAAVQGAALPADDAGGGEADMVQAPSLPSAFAGVDGPQGCFLEPGSSLFGAGSLMDGAASLFGTSYPLPSPSLALGIGSGGGGGGMANVPSLPMLNAPSLLGGGAGMGGIPANAMDTARFDSLLLELGPDFLPDFEPQMSPQQAGR